MQPQLRCVHCGGLFTPCRRVRNHRYCSNPNCQRARKREWHKRKLVTDEDYRLNQGDAQRRWRVKNSDYWRKYRSSHPEYAHRNKERQKIRNRNKAENCSLAKMTRPLIAKMDAIKAVSAKISGKYRLIPISVTGIAKMDALIVEISVVSPVFP